MKKFKIIAFAAFTGVIIFFSSKIDHPLESNIRDEFQNFALLKNVDLDNFLNKNFENVLESSILSIDCALTPQLTKGDPFDQRKNEVSKKVK